MKTILSIALILSLCTGCASSNCRVRANSLVREAQACGLESGVGIYRPFEGCETLHASVWINYEHATGWYDCDTGKRMVEPAKMWAVFEGELK